jgi:hypothetical protein
VDEQRAFLFEIARRLDGAGIPYMLTGSLALAAYAIPRMTRDIDIVVEIRPTDADRLVALFEKDCHIELGAVRRAAAERDMFNVIHDTWITKADFIVRKDEPYRKTEFDRRRTIDVEGTGLWVVAPEDLILSKLCWSRASPSERQQDDVRHLLAVENLDWAYLDRWARDLGVGEALRRLRGA